MEYVDTHCHLDNIYDFTKTSHDVTLDEFGKDWEPGFSGLITVFSESFEATLEFLNKGDPRIHGALGIHPHDASKYTDELEATLERHLQHPQIVALGEIGLDYHYDNSPRDIQKQVFARQIKLAVKLNLPIVIHTREAEDDTIEIIKENMPKEHKFHVHCYTDSWKLPEFVLANYPNSFFGFTGVLTFKKSEDIRDVCSKIPMDRLLSETDGPFMAPVPFRGKKATPGHIPTIIRKVAEIHKIPEEEAFRIMRENCKRMYGF